MAEPNVPLIRALDAVYQALVPVEGLDHRADELLNDASALITQVCPDPEVYSAITSHALHEHAFTYAVTLGTAPQVFLSPADWRRQPEMALATACENALDWLRSVAPDGDFIESAEVIGAECLTDPQRCPVRHTLGLAEGQDAVVYRKPDPQV